MSASLTASGFLSTLGVNVHVEYTDGKYANAANVIADLAYLGETHVRDAVLNPYNQGQWNYDALAQAGIKFDMFFQGTDLSSTLGLVDAFVKRHPGAVSLIEGPNEVNNFPIAYGGLTGNAGATAYQAALYAAVKSDSALKTVPVADLTSYPFLSGPSDDSNYHFYGFHGQQPQIAYGAGFFSDLAIQAASKPVVMTEGGYNTLLLDPYYGGVNEATQAKLLLNLYCDDAKAGVQTTYVYQLLDAYADPTNSDSDKHFGLFNLDNSPKLAATAIHNLTSVLSTGADAGAAPTTLAYTASGLPAQGGMLDLTKNSTTHDILIWNEPTIWNSTTLSPVAASATNVAIHLAQAADVVVYDPLISGQSIASYSHAQDIVVSVTDHPLIVEVTSISRDTLVLPEASAATMVTVDGNGVLHLINGSQDTTAANIKTIQFADRTATTSNADVVVDNYASLLGRNPTGAELSVWSSALANGASLSDMSAIIARADASGAGESALIRQSYQAYLGRDATSGEIGVWESQFRSGTATLASFSATLAGVSAAQGRLSPLIADLYQLYLGRAPSAAETNAWSNALTQGVVDERGINLNLSEQAGATTNLLTTLYQSYLGSNPTAADLAYWTPKVQNGLYDADQVKTVLLNDAAGHAHTAGTLTALYETYFDRAPQPKEVAVWETNLENGATFDTVKQVIAADPAAMPHNYGVITGLYDTYMGRDPSKAELDTWERNIQSGTTDNAIRSTILLDPGGMAHTNATISSYYTDFMGRLPTAAELAYWQSALLAGGTFGDARSAVLATPQSASFVDTVIQNDYITYLGRSPVSTEYTTWHSLINSGAGYDDLVSALLNDPSRHASAKDLTYKDLEASTDAIATAEDVSVVHGAPTPELPYAQTVDAPASDGPIFEHVTHSVSDAVAWSYAMHADLPLL